MEEHGTLVAMQSFVDCLPIAAAVTSCDGVVTKWNDIASDLFGYAPGEVVGKPFPGVSNDSFELFQRALQQCSRGDSCDNSLLKVSFKDGLVEELSMAYGPLTDAKQAVVGCIFTFDRPVEFYLQQLQQESLEQVQALISAPDSKCWQIGADGKIIAASAGFAKMLGCTSDDLVGQNALSYATSGSQPALQQLVVVDGVTAVSDALELELVRSDGSTFWAAVSVLSCDMTARHILLSVEDITDVKETQEVARQLQERWELVSGTNDAVWDWDMRSDTVTDLI